MKRATIWRLRRAASLALAVSILSALSGICLLISDLLRWLIEGAGKRVTVGRLIGLDGFWLRVPLWAIVAAISVLMLILFFETWRFAVRKDMAVDAARGRAECGHDVEDDMV